MEDHPNVNGGIVAVFFSNHVDVINCTAGSGFGNDGCGLCRIEILGNSVQNVDEPGNTRNLNVRDLQEAHEFSKRKQVGVTGVRLVRGDLLFEENARIPFDDSRSFGSQEGLNEGIDRLEDSLSRYNSTITHIGIGDNAVSGGPTNDFCDYSDAGQNNGWGYNSYQQTGERCPPERNPNAAAPAQTTPETPQECRDAKGIDRNAYVIVNRHGGVEYSADHPHRRNCNLVGGDNFGSDGCGVCSIEGVNEEPAPAPEQATEPVSQGNGGAHPPCRNGSNSDSDGDGYGWENGGSCIVVTTQQTVNNPSTQSSGSSTHSSGKPYCLDAATADYDGDGYGWENNETCIVRNSAADK